MHGVDLGLVAAEQLAEKIAVVAPVAVQGEVLDAQAHAVGRERDGIGGLIGGNRVEQCAVHVKDSQFFLQKYSSG